MRSRIESVGISLPRKGMISRGSIDHAVTAGKNCITKTSYPLSLLNVVINTGVYRDEHMIEPAIASIIQEKLDINPDFHGKDTFSFDLINGGCGLLNGIEAMTNLLMTDDINAGMVVTSEANTDADPSPEYLYKRSGAALIIDRSPDPEIGFGDFVFETFDEYSESYTATISLEQKGGKLSIHKKPELESIYLQKIPLVVAKLLKREGLQMADIDLVIPSQISSTFASELGASLGISEDKVIDIFKKTKADTLSTSIALGYEFGLKKGMIQPGMKLLMIAAGSGVTIGATVYYC